MNRAASFVSHAWRIRDFHSLGLLATIAVIAGWLIAMPFSRSVQHATINRFHLTSGSFAQWAIQQPIPPMYNLENQYWYSPRPLTLEELTNPPPSGVKSGTVNHFPARMITCASGRLLMLENQRDCWFYLKSRYQQSERITTYRLESVPESNSLILQLAPENESH